MTNYFISVIGMAVISVVVELILPHGRMHGFVRSMCSLFLFFVIVVPIINFTKKTNAVEDLTKSINSEFVLNVGEYEIKALKSNIKSALEYDYGVNFDVEINYKSEKGVASISKIVLCAENIENVLNSNDIDNLKSRVKLICGNDVEVVIVG